jgi:hypothetical protein|tara:strand:+ start:1651 stop:1821 length:171 start_codon:yes stop_codon:yes gene_type:complete
MSKYTRAEILQQVADRANLRGADLSRANLFSAYHDAQTKWSKGFDPEAAMAMSVED